MFCWPSPRSVGNVLVIHDHRSTCDYDFLSPSRGDIHKLGSDCCLTPVWFMQWRWEFLLVYFLLKRIRKDLEFLKFGKDKRQAYFLLHFMSSFEREVVTEMELDLKEGLLADSSNRLRWSEKVSVHWMSLPEDSQVFMTQLYHFFFFFFSQLLLLFYVCNTIAVK